MGSSSGVSSLLEKDAAGHGGLQPLQELLAKLSVKLEPEAEENAEPVISPVAEAGLTLVGVAAGGGTEGASTASASWAAPVSAHGEAVSTPTPKPKRSASQSAVQRTPSSRSLASGEDAGAAAPTEEGSECKEEKAEDPVPGDRGHSQNELFQKPCYLLFCALRIPALQRSVPLCVLSFPRLRMLQQGRQRGVSLAPTLRR